MSRFADRFAYPLLVSDSRARLVWWGQEAGVPMSVLRAACGPLVESTALTGLMGGAVPPRYKPVRYAMLVGHAGRGKSVAAARWLLSGPALAKDKLTRVCWLQSRNLQRVSQYDAEEIDALCSVPYMVVDDLGAEYLDDRGFIRGLLDEILCTRFDNNLSTVLTSNLLKVEDFNARYGDRVLSRLRSLGEIVVCGGGDIRVSGTAGEVVYPAIEAI